ncbi:MAG: glutamyl-tRNA reductase [Alphaproteobacteria bacterium]|jgi:glutamyl-tRNA reductase
MSHPPENRAAPADYVVVGASHKTSSTALRDRIFVEPADEDGVFAALRACGLDQVVVVSTCDRVEFHGVAADVGNALPAVRSILEARQDGGTAAPECVYELCGEDAVRHVFAVASSLESATIGETEVLGQLKDAHARARVAGSLGPELDSLFQKAFAAAKDVRTNTGIAEGPVSLANAALRAVRNLFGDLDNVSALLLGPGEMGVLMLEHFKRHGLRHVTVAGPTETRAASAAHAFEAHAVTYEGLSAALESADLIIGAAATGRMIVTAEMMRAAIRARRHKPVFILDVAVPADAERTIHELDDVFLYDLDDLEDISRSNHASRDAAAAEAFAIVDQHVAAFFEASAERGAVREVSDMRAYFEAVRADILANSDGAGVEDVTRRLINRLLHNPSEALRRAARDGETENFVATAARRLFALDEQETSGAATTPRGSEENEH